MSSPVSLSQTPRPHGELAISIIVPVFNKERYLAECLRSILSQTLEDIEVICVDDASSDNSPAILDEIGRADPRVVVYRNPINLGSGASRNLGIERARGAYLQFTDANDLLAPNALQTLLQLALATDCSLVRGSVSVFPGGQASDWLEAHCTGLRVPDRKRFSFSEEPGMWVPWFHTSYLFMRRFLIGSGIRYPELRGGEDPIFLGSALVKSPIISSTSEISYFYRTDQVNQRSTVAHMLDDLRHMHALKSLLMRRYARCWTEGCSPLYLLRIKEYLEEYALNHFERVEVEKLILDTWSAEDLEKAGLSDRVEQLDRSRVADKTKERQTSAAERAGPQADGDPTHRSVGIGQAKKRPAVRVHLYAQCWNDEFMLPYFFRHYDSFVDRYVIFDDGSTDRSQAILAAHPKVELRRFVRSDPESFVISEQALSNQCWKESRGEADWVIITDVDEHLYHPEMREYLITCKKSGVTAIPALGFQMLGEEPTWIGQRLCEEYLLGAPWAQMMKLSIFDPNQIMEIHFAHGRHHAEPIGNVSTPAKDEVLLLHYKYLGIERTYRRQQQLMVGLRAQDIANQWGVEYSWSRAELERDWQSLAARAVDVHQVTTDTYPIERWWDRETRVPRAGHLAYRQSVSNQIPAPSDPSRRAQLNDPLSTAAFDAAIAAHRSAVASALAIIDAEIASEDPGTSANPSE